jgi:hypothetical protein
VVAGVGSSIRIVVERERDSEHTTADRNETSNDETNESRGYNNLWMLNEKESGFMK